MNFRSGLIRALMAAGFKVATAAPADVKADAELLAMGCTVHHVGMNAKGLSPLDDLSTLWAYRSIMRAVRPCAFLGYTVKPNVYGGMAARMTNIPHIANISGLGTAFISRNFVTHIVSILYRIGLAKSSTVFFQNTDDRDLFVHEKLIRREQAFLVPGSGIDTDYFAPGSMQPKAAKHFLMVARLLRDKGVIEFVDAARILKKHHPDLRFSIVGFLDVQNRTAISRSEVDAWVSEGIIEYIPPVDDVRPIIASCDAVVLPSYREGTSRVLLEAAAMAKPAIASDVPGCREVVREGINGYLCAPRDAQSLANAMLKLSTVDGEKLQSMGRAGRDLVMTEFSQSRVSTLYLDALRRVCLEPNM